MEPLVWHCEKRIVNKLIPWERNPRQMTVKQARELEQSIKNLNLIDIPAIDIDETLVGGHRRCEILQLLGRGEEEIDVRVPNRKLTEEEFQEANLRLNKNTGEWNPDLLASFPEELLKNVGFTDEELSNMFQLDMGPEPAEGEDDIPEPPVEPKSKIGDLYQLGRHRLLCGDSTKREDVERLMGGEKADMVFTDPPYGIEIVTNYAMGKKGERLADGKNFAPVIGNDKEYNPSHLFEWSNDVLVWGANHYAHRLPHNGKWLIWDKREDKIPERTQADCELAWYSKYGAARIFRHYWDGMMKASERGERRVHPTQKPIALCEWGFGEVEAGNNILDPFGGSGSTLIACEKTNRRCFMMEIDPIYIDVIIERWEKFSGQKAVKL